MDTEAPGAFLCPITHDVLEDPVVAPDGRTYERAHIEGWLRRQETSPFTGAPLPPPARLTPNYALRDAIERWRQQQPLPIDPHRVKLSDPREVLGQGSFGRVLGGTMEGVGGRVHPVAVKMLPDLTQVEERKNFEHELKAHLAAQQGADGICRLFGTCELEHRLCLVMRRYASNLSTRIEEGLEPPAVQTLAHALFRTLGQLHAAGIVVQDIKPPNILLDEYDRPVLADFGISVLVSRTTRVVPTSVKGTFNYMAPEAFNPAGFGVEVDLWSMGCVVVEMVTGKMPWDGLQMQQIMCAVYLEKKAPEVPDVTPAADLIRRCFAYNPADRPGAADVCSALEPPPPDSTAISKAAHDLVAAELAALRTDNDSLRTDNESLRAEKAMLSEQLEAAMGVIEEMHLVTEDQSDRSVSRDAHEDLRATNDRLTSQVSGLTDELDMVTEEVEELVSINKGLVQELEFWRSQPVDNTRGGGGGRSEVEHRQVLRENERLAQELTALREATQHDKTELEESARLSAKMQRAVDGQAAAVRGQIAEYENEIDRLKGELALSENEIETLMGFISELNDELKLIKEGGAGAAAE
eukprot:m.465989 g.465989  ORF g.465989 m.465989 type:complete len:582 (+) comp24785_c0_seq1:29-1774(+)